MVELQVCVVNLPADLENLVVSLVSHRIKVKGVAGQQCLSDRHWSTPLIDIGLLLRRIKWNGLKYILSINVVMYVFRSHIISSPQVCCSCKFDAYKCK